MRGKAVVAPRREDPLARFAATLDASDPEEAMRLSCQRLLDAAGQKHGPVPQSRLLAILGARVEQMPLPTAGKLRIDDRGYLVCVRADARWRRARFTVAHELGHILLCETLKDRPATLRALQEPTHWEAVERLCDQAAAELLMPAEDFHRQLDGREISKPLLVELRKRYGVSWTALAIRFNDLLGFGVSSWRRYQRHPEERITFRVHRCWRSGGNWVPKGLTARYLQPDVVNGAAARGEASGRGVLAFGDRSSEVLSVAIALDDSEESAQPASFLADIEPVSSRPVDPTVLLLLKPVEMKGREESSLGPQQLALIG
ncbi:MAG TPA: ImmA/IrrE family metallo-endopeptidase [Solirubrobacterales bacterium]|nr:ImmA/IrrE family metallo-endopeptidase [Solirubrobacterales bacterium]